LAQIPTSNQDTIVYMLRLRANVKSNDNLI
jgi:hypothetical protein